MGDDDSPIYEIREPDLDSGLRGIPVGTCQTSFVDPIEGVHYVGYPVEDLVNMEEEDVIYLLFNKRLPTEEESNDFRTELAHRAEEMPTGALRVLESLTPGTGHPMDWLSTGILALGISDTTGDLRTDSMNLVARMPELMARIFHLRGGKKLQTRDSRPQLGLVENFTHILGIDGDEAERMNRVLRFFFILHMDHGGGNLSTFSGKAVASGRASIYAAISSAMSALSGPLHGRANQSCLEFVKRIGTDDPDEIENFVRRELSSKRPIYGFGHGVLRAEDPRARLLIELGEEVCPEDPDFRTVKTLREVVPPILSEIPKISNPPQCRYSERRPVAICGIQETGLLHHFLRMVKSRRHHGTDPRRESGKRRKRDSYLPAEVPREKPTNQETRVIEYLCSSPSPYVRSA